MLTCMLVLGDLLPAAKVLIEVVVVAHVSGTVAFHKFARSTISTLLLSEVFDDFLLEFSFTLPVSLVIEKVSACFLNPISVILWSWG